MTTNSIDAAGKLVTVPGDTVTVQIKHTNNTVTLSANVVDNKTGTYTAHTNLNFSGKCEVHVVS